MNRGRDDYWIREYQRRIQEIEDEEVPLVGSALEAAVIGQVLPFAQVNDAELREVVQPALLTLPRRRTRNRDISERHLAGHQLTPASPYNRGTMYRFRGGPLLDNVELALQSMYGRIRENPFMGNGRLGRIRIVSDTMRERLVRVNWRGRQRQQNRPPRNPEFTTRVFESADQLNSFQGYMAFRDTLLQMFNSNEDLDLLGLEFIFEVRDVNPGEIRGGARPKLPALTSDQIQQLQTWEASAGGAASKSKDVYRRLQAYYRNKDNNEWLKVRRGVLYPPPATEGTDEDLCGWYVLVFLVANYDVDYALTLVPTYVFRKYENMPPFKLSEIIARQPNLWKVL